MFPNKNSETRKKSKKPAVNSKRLKLVEKHKLDKKASRGTYVISHEKGSGMNYITVLDSKPVSLLSTAAGVTPLTIVERYDKDLKSRNQLNFPGAFKIYNQYMGGVDLHDQHCSDMKLQIGGKKWTWAVLCRIIQSALTNGLILYNMVHDVKI